MKEKKCPICGVTFTQERKNQKYCCDECRKVAKRNQSKKEERKVKIGQIAILNRRAMELGMSYGKYVAMIERPNKIKRKDR